MSKNPNVEKAAQALAIMPPSLTVNSYFGDIADTLDRCGLLVTPLMQRAVEADTAYQDSAFVSVTQSGVGTSVRCRCVGGEVSNVIAVVPAGSFPHDTTLYAFFARTPNVPARMGGGATEARWVGAAGDTAAVTVMTIDYEQSSNRADHCRACGYWWLRGVRQVCP